MPNKMLIDATHPEETRVVVLRGQRVEEFDFESASRKQLRGNIYLAKVTRVEPSLQAAFVDYGGNRHGFLAFSEIHPDYYQIPVADRQALIAEDERAQRAADAEADHRVVRRQRGSTLRRDEIKSEPLEADDESEGELGQDHASPDDASAMAAGSEQMAPQADSSQADLNQADLIHSVLPHAPVTAQASTNAPVTDAGEAVAPAGSDIPMNLAQLETSSAAEPIPHESAEDLRGQNRIAPDLIAPDLVTPDLVTPGLAAAGHDVAAPAQHTDVEATEISPSASAANITEVNGPEGEEEMVESVGGADAMEEVPERMPRLRRQYKIQEVIKRRQVIWCRWSRKSAAPRVRL